jgi:hypothetical protein
MQPISAKWVPRFPIKGQKEWLFSSASNCWMKPEMARRAVDGHNRKQTFLLVRLEHHTTALQWKVTLCTFEESEASYFQHEAP